MKKLLTLIMVLAVICGSSLQVMAANSTPYTENTAQSGFMCGATFVLEQTPDYESWLGKELQKARDIYNIHTVTVYGLEDFDDSYKSAFFAQLERLGMKVCIRIESYDAATFAFTAEDAQKVMKRYENLVAFTCKEEYRDQVQYYALNMPVDDPAVQANLGDVNSQLSKTNQVIYAKEIVRLMRQFTKEKGYENAKLYLSVFYGWDGTYEVPSYADAGADGYFINNYSYPQGKNLPGADADPEEIINAKRLQSIIELFLEDYPQEPPLVIECGFHTLQYNDGNWPGQTAGLVLDRQTKGVALKAVVDFYRKNYPFVEGLLYFGYNLFKEEGQDATIMDWALQYPVEGYCEAETAGYAVDAKLEDAAASEGSAVKLEAEQRISFVDCMMSQQAVVFYRAEEAATVQVYSAGQLKKEIQLPATQGYGTYGFPLVLVDGYDLELVAVQGAVVLDKILLLPHLEAEYAQCSGQMETVEDLTASMELAVEKAVGAENALVFAGVRGGDTMELTYRAEKETQLKVVIDEQSFRVTLPAAKKMTTVAISASVPKDASLQLYAAADCGLLLDCVALSGIPAAVRDSTVTPMPVGNDHILPVAIGAAAAVIATAAILWIILRRKK